MICPTIVLTDSPKLFINVLSHLQVERLVPLASKEELTEFGHLFVARTRRNLSDSHLWFSVLARPANSRFTRVQRLSCCLCLLLMSMMASGMYYERENDSANVQHVGQFVFTWEQVKMMKTFFPPNRTGYLSLTIFTQSTSPILRDYISTTLNL